MSDSETGGSQIINYDLVWDMGTDGVSWETFELLEEVEGSQIIPLTIYGLSSGFTYQFKYRAQNIHGLSPAYSSSASVKTLTEPHALDVPQTIVNDNYVTILWAEPYSGGAGVLITAYEIMIKNKQGDFLSSEECDGTLTEIVNNQYCDIQMSTLTNEFNLELGDLVVAIVRAINDKGVGQFSGSNSEGALIEVMPTSPTEEPSRGPLTNELRIDVVWEPLTTYT